MSRGAAGQAGEFQGRTWFMFAVLVLGAGGLVADAVYMQLVKRDFLKEQGDARFVRDHERPFLGVHVFERGRSEHAVALGERQTRNAVAHAH